jgi:hypothetical protein
VRNYSSGCVAGLVNWTFARNLSVLVNRLRGLPTSRWMQSSGVRRKVLASGAAVYPIQPCSAASPRFRIHLPHRTISSCTASGVM